MLTGGDAERRKGGSEETHAQAEWPPNLRTGGGGILSLYDPIRLFREKRHPCPKDRVLLILASPDSHSPEKTHGSPLE